MIQPENSDTFGNLFFHPQRNALKYMPAMTPDISDMLKTKNTKIVAILKVILICLALTCLLAACGGNPSSPDHIREIMGIKLGDSEKTLSNKLIAKEECFSGSVRKPFKEFLIDNIKDSVKYKSSGLEISSNISLTDYEFDFEQANKTFMGFQVSILKIRMVTNPRNFKEEVVQNIWITFAKTEDVVKVENKFCDMFGGKPSPICNKWTGHKNEVFISVNSREFEFSLKDDLRDACKVKAERALGRQADINDGLK